MHSKLRAFAVVAILTFFFALPLSIVMMGGGAMAISGIILIGTLMLIQLPAYFLLKRLLPRREED